MNWLLSRIRGDVHIWLIVFIMTAISIMEVYSSSGTIAYIKYSGNTEYYLFRQLVFILIGLLFMYGTHLINYVYFSRLAQILLIISIPLLVLTLFNRPSINDARRWLVIPGTKPDFSDFRPGQTCPIMYLARMLSKRQKEY
jgi:cell division protein FtsW